MSRQDPKPAADPHRGTRTRPWRRRLLRALGWGAIGALLLLSVLIVSLRLPSARQAWLRQAGEAIEESTGAVMTASDFSLALWRGELILDDLVLRASPEAPPFVTVANTQARLSWPSLLADRIVIRAVSLVEPHFDLGAPLPKPPPSEEPPADAEPIAIDIESITLTGGRGLSGPLPASAEPWLDHLRVEEVTISGFFRGGELRLEPVTASVVADRDTQPSITAELQTRVLYREDGDLSIETLQLEGDGLLLAADGRLGLTDRPSGDRDPLDLSLTLQAEPALLLPDLATGGRLKGDGQLTLANDVLNGDVRLDIQELPGELVRPWLTASGVEVEVDGTLLDAKADLKVEASMSSSAEEPLQRLVGQADVNWRRGEEKLLALALRSEAPEAAGLRLAFEGEVLPADAGRRQLVGELRAPGWASIDQGRLAATRFQLDLPDLAATMARLGLPQSFGAFHPTGSVRAIASASGPILSPDLKLDATWQLADAPLAAIRARTLGPFDVEEPLHLTFDVEGFPQSPGHRQLVGEVWADDTRALAAGELAGVRLEGVRLETRIPDLAITAMDLQQTWQVLFPGLEIPAALAPDSVLATGRLGAEVDLAGPVVMPRLEADVEWQPAAKERLAIELEGDLGAEAPFFAGLARLRASELDVARLAAAGGSEGLEGRVSGTVDFEGDLGSHVATLEAQASGLGPSDGVSVEHMTLTARSDGTHVEIARLAGSLTSGQPFSGRGQAELTWLSAEGPPAEIAPWVGDAALSLELSEPIDTLERLSASFQLDDGIICAEIAFKEAGLPPRPVALARAPWGTVSAGAGNAWLAVSGLELAPFLPFLDLPPDIPRPRVTLDGTLTVDLADPLAAYGTIEMSNLAVEGPEEDIEAVGSLRLDLQDWRLTLAPTRLLGTKGEALEARGRFELSPSWRSGDDPLSLISDISLDLAGRLETSVLNPLLAGGRASGVMDVDLKVRGSAAAPVLEGHFEGPGVELFYAAPYITRIASPVVRLSGDADATSFAAQARLNGGETTAKGRFASAGAMDLKADFTGVRYRLDYGLTTRLAGDLALRRSADSTRSRLTGQVVLERGSLRNDVALDRETLAQLLAPDMTSAEAASATERIDLDLVVTTGDGVRVKNNLGELRADWGTLRVRGTLQKPLLSGRIEVDPGGKLTAYGQTLRIDQASIDFSGDVAAPRVELETTSSLQDPSIKDDRRSFSRASLGDDGPGSGGYWSQRRSQGSGSRSEEITTGVLTHLGDRVAGSLGQGLSRTELSLEPLSIFGETDTSARLTAKQEISREANLIYSVNPRDAEGQTYILELHSANLAPSLTAQVFTNDENNEGVTLRQALQFGAGRRREHQTRVGGIRIELPEEVDRRRFFRTLGLRKYDPFPDDAEFDVEIDAIEALRRQGFPSAEVKVAVDASAPRRPVLDVEVDPGPRARFEFVGTRPPGPIRRSIVQAYNPNAEETSLQDMRRATVRALRGQGYLEPQVEVSAEAGASEDGPGARKIRVSAEGGRKVTIGPLVLDGVSPEVAAWVASQFLSQLSRVELAMAVPGADQYLLESLAAVGHPQAQILSRALSEDGKHLTLSLEPGRRQRLARLDVLGLAPEDAARLIEALPIAVGDPIRSDRVTQAAYQIEDEMQRRGHAKVEVRTFLEPDEGDGDDLALRFEVDAGPVHQIAGVRLEGLESTRDAWASRIAGLEAGTLFREDDVGRARRQLMATGLFHGVRATTRSSPSSDGAGRPESDGVEPSEETETTVVFQFDERPRYQVSYGGRWESGEGLGLVVDAVDQSFRGRGTTLGVRAIYSGEEDRSLRLYHAIPRFRGSNAGLEVFLEGKNEELEGTQVSGVETWTQLTFPLSRQARSRLYFRYQDLSVREISDSGDDPADAALGTGHFVIPSIGWQLSVDTRDRALGAERPDGLFASVDLVFSHGDLGSDAGALGVFSQLKFFKSIAGGGWRRLSEAAEEQAAAGLPSTPSGSGITWAQSIRVGLQEPFEDNVIPSVNRLRAGGEYSVRGYRRDSLGPLDNDGDSLGGELFLVLNQELRFPIWSDWLGGVVFFDAGNVWESRDAFESELLTSTGLGLRAVTPIGPLRLDVAVPLDRRPEIDDSVRIYLGFGNVF